MNVELKSNFYFIYNTYYNKLENISAKYILDSNIVADLEYFYNKPEKMNEQRKQCISELLHFLRDKSTNYDYALTELSLNYEKGGIIEEKYKSTKHAVSKTLKMSPSKIRGHAQYGKNKDNLPLYSKQLNFGLPSKVIPATLPLLTYSYVPLLKLFYEIKINSSNKQKIMENYFDYLNGDLNVLPLYEVCFATYLFFTNDAEFDNVQSLLKINNKTAIIRKIWNVSWDITFLRYINSLPARIASGENVYPKANFILITQDKALGQISNLLKMNDENSFESKVVSNITIDIQQIRPQYQDWYKKMYNHIMSPECFNRRKTFLSTCDPLAHIQSMLLKADELQTLLLQ